MKIATKDLKDEALLWAAVSAVWPNDSCVMKPYSCSKASLIDMYGSDIINALVQEKLGEFVDVPDHLV